MMVVGMDKAQVMEEVTGTRIQEMTIEMEIVTTTEMVSDHVVSLTEVAKISKEDLGTVTTE